jgi:hypothetical protein
MAMFVCNSEGTTLQCWYVGEYIQNANSAVSDDVCEVQADGHELAAILHQFQNLPRCDGSVQTWYGDMAKFIVGNLRS